MTETTRVPLAPDMDQWDVIIEALQAVADSDPGDEAASDLAVLLRNAIDRVVPGTYGGCAELSAVTDDEAALIPAPSAAEAQPFADEWPATVVKAQLKVATAALDSMKADDERAGEALETIARLAAEQPEIRDPRNENPVAPEPEPEPPLPPGEYARVEIMGHDSEFGWVTERTRAGVLVMVVSDWDGRVKAEIPGASLYRFVPLPTPQKRPEPQKALTALVPADPDDDIDGGYGAHIPACRDPECDGECMERTPF